MPHEAIADGRVVQSSAQCQSRKARPDAKAADSVQSTADERQEHAGNTRVCTGGYSRSRAISPTVQNISHLQ